MLDALRRFLARGRPPAPQLPDLPQGARIAAALTGAVAGDAGAARAVRAELEEVRGLGWIALDLTLRDALETWFRVLPGAREDAPALVRALDPPADAAPFVVAALASHPDGHVREAAVERLAGLPGAVPLAPLLVRAGEWVEPVRRRATAALGVRLRPELAEAWVDSLLLVVRLGASAHPEARALAAAVRAFLATEPARAAVTAGLASGDRDVRRTCFRCLLDGAPDDARRVVAGLAHEDGVIRTYAARAAERMDDAAAAGLAPLLLPDSLPAVRAAGVRLAARVGWMEDALLRAAFDPAALVRREARAALGGDAAWFAAEYRRALVEGRPNVGALLGLAETGGAEDAKLAEACLIDLRPGVRRAAVVALDRLSGEGAVRPLTWALADTSPRVSRAAAERLRARTRKVDAGPLAALLAADRPRHVRLGALGLLAARGKWDGVRWILDALADDDPAVGEAAGRLLEGWRRRFNRSAVAPTAEQRAAALAALARAEPRLAPDDVRWLRFALG